jgi:beta-glucosidase
MKCTKEHRLKYTDKALELVKQMSLEEKVHLMSGWVKPKDQGTPAGDEHYNFRPYGAAGNERLGLAPMKFCDGPRGVVCGTGRSTVFLSRCSGARPLIRSLRRKSDMQSAARSGRMAGTCSPAFA